jgi:hypothetical protein
LEPSDKCWGVTTARIEPLLETPMAA